MPWYVDAIAYFVVLFPAFIGMHLFAAFDC